MENLPELKREVWYTERHNTFLTNGRYIKIKEGEKIITAVVVQTEKELSAARLIAAAPRMFNALLLFLEEKSFNHAVEQAKEAISDATGKDIL